MNARERAWTGQRIRRHRRGHGLTQAALATEVKERSGQTVELHQSTISKWESGDTEVSLRYRRYLAEALEIPIDILFEAPPHGWHPPAREREAA